MTNWQVQDAKARFSELLDTALRKGPQVVTRRGKEEAVLVPITLWRRVEHAARPSLKEWLLADQPKFEMQIPQRGRLRWRKPPAFD
jgi:antitoxin Phd